MLGRRQLPACNSTGIAIGDQRLAQFNLGRVAARVRGMMTEALVAAPHQQAHGPYRILADDPIGIELCPPRLHDRASLPKAGVSFGRTIAASVRYERRSPMARGGRPMLVSAEAAA